MDSTVGQRVVLVNGPRTLYGVIRGMEGHYADVLTSSLILAVEVDTRTARPSRRCRSLTDAHAWRVRDEDAERLGWGAERDNALLLPREPTAARRATRRPMDYAYLDPATGRPFSPGHAIAAAPPEAVADPRCEACGHGLAMHGSEAPSPCMHGRGPCPVPVGARVTPELAERLDAWERRGCDCVAYKRAPVPAPVSRRRRS